MHTTCISASSVLLLLMSQKLCVSGLVSSFTGLSPRSHLVVDWEVCFSPEGIEEALALQYLRKARPPVRQSVALGEVLSENRQPWDSAEELPSHRFRTFDMSRKYRSVLNELCFTRPCETVLLLRLLFEEDAIGRPAIGGRSNPRGTRPLTAGEIATNWDEVVRDRCIAKWAQENGANNSEDIEAMLSGMDSELQSLQRKFVESDLEECTSAMALPDGLRSAVWDTVGRQAAPGSHGVTFLLRNTSPWTDKQAYSFITRELGETTASIEDITLRRVSSVSEIETILDEQSSSSANEGMTYLSAYWNQLVLLGAVVSKRRELFLVEWCKRSNNMMDRAKAKASNCFLSAEDLFQSTSVEYAQSYLSVQESVLGVSIPSRPRTE
jgi:hypothetical protein